MKGYTVFVPNLYSSLVVYQGTRGWLVSYTSSIAYALAFNNITTKPRFSSITSTLTLETCVSNSFWGSYLSLYNELIASSFSPTFKKIKFKGKGYYIYKNNRNTITPQFGYSHRIYIYSFFNNVRFLGKTTVLLFGLVKSDVIKSSLSIKEKRTVNIFTGRGVRFARQTIYKKQGKVSSYR